MNRKDFLKRLGLLTTTAVVTPEILAEQSQVATTEPVERMRIGSYPDGSSFIIWPNTDKELRK